MDSKRRKRPLDTILQIASSSDYTLQDDAVFDQFVPIPSQLSILDDAPKNDNGLDIIRDRADQYEVLLLAIQTAQTSLILNQKGSVKALKEMQDGLAASLRQDYNLLQSKFAAEILSPTSLLRLDDLSEMLRFQIARLLVYQEEFSNYVTHYEDDYQLNFFARLFIASQPKTAVISKAKAGTHAQVVVKLILGVATHLKYISEMSAKVVTDDIEGRLSAPPMKYFEEKTCILDPHQSQAVWHHRFVSGTRKQVSHIQYTLHIGVTESRKEIMLQSELGRDFIVITNDCQWHEAESISLQRRLFSRHTHVAWIYFVNTINFHFLIATRQEKAESIRPIFPLEWAYFHRNFFDEGPSVDRSQFLYFWDWFGRWVQKLRYQPQILQFFKLGCLSFLPKKSPQVGIDMLNFPPGTFILRFSETKPGNIAIAYRASSATTLESVRHYLHPTDGGTSKTTLVEFLRDQPPLLHMLVSKKSLDLEFVSIPKSSIIQILSPKKQVTPSTNAGYDSEIISINSSELSAFGACE